MKELLLCDQKCKFDILIIVFSGNTSRISAARGNQSPLLDANEVKKLDFGDSKGLSKNSTSPNNLGGGIKSPSPHKRSMNRTPPSNRISLKIKTSTAQKDIDDEFDLQDMDFRQTERMFRESLGKPPIN